MDKCEGCKIAGVHCLGCPEMDAKIMKRIEDAGKNTRASDEVIRGLVEALEQSRKWMRINPGASNALNQAEKALAQARGIWVSRLLQSTGSRGFTG